MLPIYTAKRYRDRTEEIQASNDGLAAWLEEHTVASHEATIPQSDLHAAYALHCRRCSRRPASKQAFGRLLRALRPDIEPTQRTLAGRRTWVYVGIALRGAADKGPREEHLESL